MSRVLIFGGSRSQELLHAAERRGLEVLVLTAPELLQGAELPPCVVHSEAVDFGQPIGLVRRILELDRHYDLRGIVPVLEYGLEAAAVAARQLGLPSVSTGAVRSTRDKVLMREKLWARDLDTVRFAHCRSVEEAERFLAEVGSPIFVKPAAGTASDGVGRVETANELVEAFDRAASSRVRGRVICEEFLTGPEISLEGCSVDGRFVPIAFTDKRIDERFVEVGHTQPSRLPPDVLDRAAELVAQSLAALGVAGGVTHSELKMTPRGPVLVETHTRLGGDNIHRLTDLTTGVDLADLMVGFALGEALEVAPRETGQAAAIRWLLGGPGRIERMDLPPQDPSRGLVESGSKVRPGTLVEARSSSARQLAYVLAMGPTPEAAEERADRFVGEIEVEYGTDEPAAAVGG